MQFRPDQCSLGRRPAGGGSVRASHPSVIELMQVLALVMMAEVAATGGRAALAGLSVPVSDVFRASGPGGGGKDAPVSFWCCSMVQGKHNTLLFAQASVKQKPPRSRAAITEGYVGITVMAKSSDSGATWSNMTAV
eukprot:COSAG02_NODE_31916_length_525_cov_0.854460_1_plen_135_part_10